MIRAPPYCRLLIQKIAKGMMKIIVADFTRKINFLDEKYYKNNLPMQGRTMNVTDFFIVELQNGAVKVSPVVIRD